MVEKSGKIIVKDEDGKETECDVLFTFDSEETKKSYVVYTDNTKDELGNIRVFANTYDKDKEDGELGPIETDKEWAVIEQIFASINDSRREN